MDLLGKESFPNKVLPLEKVKPGTECTVPLLKIEEDSPPLSPWKWIISKDFLYLSKYARIHKLNKTLVKGPLLRIFFFVENLTISKLFLPRKLESQSPEKNRDVTLKPVTRNSLIKFRVASSIPPQ